MEAQQAGGMGHPHEGGGTLTDFGQGKPPWFMFRTLPQLLSAALPAILEHLPEVQTLVSNMGLVEDTASAKIVLQTANPVQRNLAQDLRFKAEHPGSSTYHYVPTPDDLDNTFDTAQKEFDALVKIEGVGGPFKALLHLAFTYKLKTAGTLATADDAKDTGASAATSKEVGDATAGAAGTAVPQPSNEPTAAALPAAAGSGTVLPSGAGASTSLAGPSAPGPRRSERVTGRTLSGGHTGGSGGQELLSTAEAAVAEPQPQPAAPWLSGGASAPSGGPLFPLRLPRTDKLEIAAQQSLAKTRAVKAVGVKQATKEKGRTTVLPVTSVYPVELLRKVAAEVARADVKRVPFKNFAKTWSKRTKELLADVEPAALQAAKELAKRVGKHNVAAGDFQVPKALCQRLEEGTVALMAVIQAHGVFHTDYGLMIVKLYGPPGNPYFRTEFLNLTLDKCVGGVGRAKVEKVTGHDLELLLRLLPRGHLCISFPGESILEDLVKELTDEEKGELARLLEKDGDEALWTDAKLVGLPAPFCLALKEILLVEEGAPAQGAPLHKRTKDAFLLILAPYLKMG